MRLSSRGKHRLFFALDFEPSFKQSLAQWAQSIAYDGRAVDTYNYHLTLQFLGTVNNHQVFDIIDAIGDNKIRSFSLSANKTGYFPRNEILFADIEQGLGSINELASFLQSQLKSIDFIKREKKSFHPHITLFRDAPPPSESFVTTELSTHISDFVLMESINVKSGVHYEVVEAWPLYKGSIKEQLLGR
ncbi:RNA 2',3'-cyclic phosphodiesterase [Pleionea sp. CnH1-48]|uniref:RNA 2',3'-cyclic phosphodiesterase n=1 Tax=Pleionea sp. CnH1-48 TaxID=2954494 RepID=UPI002097883C|nr:RNA 2',3'-cyclic phosphodiesterase [Pleionea sp. CnH1-48]MCO7227346.1 RNA 2',3'-cyclic phosphodiesterase [Pleionea sp. CnH1-48]